MIWGPFGIQTEFGKHHFTIGNEVVSREGQSTLGHAKLCLLVVNPPMRA